VVCTKRLARRGSSYAHELREYTTVTSKLRRFCLYELEGKRRRRYGRT